MATVPDTPRHDADRRRLDEAASQAEVRREALHTAVVDVTSALDAAPLGTDAWLEAVRGATQRLDAAMRDHVREAEMPEGLLAEIVQWQPSYHRRADAMRAEHETMLARIADLLPRVDGSTPATELRHAVSDLVLLVDRHRHKALELVLDAHNLDLAAGD
jgi:hypothetical protein